MRVRRCERFAECGEKEGVGSFVQRSRPEAWMELAPRSCKSRSAPRWRNSRSPRPPRSTWSTRHWRRARRRERPAPERRHTVDRRHDRRPTLAEHARHAARGREPGGDGVRLRILGPNGSDGLVAALDEDLGNLQKEAEELKTARARSELPAKLADARQPAADQRRVRRHRPNSCARKRGCLPVLLRGRATRKIASRKRSGSAEPHSRRAGEPARCKTGHSGGADRCLFSFARSPPIMC